MKFQKLSRGNKALLFFILVLIIVTGFVRDFLFVNINGQIYIAYYHSEQVGVSELLKSIWGKSVQELNTLKWILTLVFTIVYFLYSTSVIYLLFKQRNYLKLTTLTFGFILATAGLFTLMGLLFPAINNRTYEVSRFLMGLIQSPIVLMILIPIFLLSTEKKSNSQP